MLTTSRKGASAELKAAAWLIDQGWEVFWNVTPSGPIDLVAVRDGETVYIDVKHATFLEPGTSGRREGSVITTAKPNSSGVEVVFLYWDSRRNEISWQKPSYTPMHLDPFATE